MTYHPVVGKIKNLLSENKFWFETFEHTPVITSEEAAKVRTGYTLHQVAKTIIVRIKVSASEKKFLMNEKIIFNAGDRSYSIAIKSADYRILVKHQILSIIVNE